MSDLIALGLYAVSRVVGYAETTVSDCSKQATLCSPSARRPLKLEWREHMRGGRVPSGSCCWNIAQLEEMRHDSRIKRFLVIDCM